MAAVFLAILLQVKVTSDNLQTLTSGENVKSEQLKGGKDAPLGFEPPTAIKLSRTLADWSRDPDNEKPWKEMMNESNGELKVNVFWSDMDVFIVNFAYYKIGQASSAKLRRFGFCGFVDTMESVFEMYKDMAKMGVLPGPKVEAARPMI